MNTELHVGSESEPNAILCEGESRETVSAPVQTGSNDPLARNGVFIGGEVSQLVKDHRLLHGEVPVDLLESDLSTYAKLLWAVLDSFSQRTIFPSKKAIQKRLSASKPTATKAQLELVSSGWLKIEYRQEKTSIYTLTYPGNHIAGGGKGACPPQETTLPPLGNHVAPEALNLNTKPKHLKTNLPPKGGVEGFDEFWISYPRHTAKSKALSSWQKLAPSFELKSAIIAAVERQKKTSQWLKDNGQFIPHPATWLNGKRWEDETIIEKPKGMQARGDL